MFIHTLLEAIKVHNMTCKIVENRKLAIKSVNSSVFQNSIAVASNMSTSSIVRKMSNNAGTFKIRSLPFRKN